MAMMNAELKPRSSLIFSSSPSQSHATPLPHFGPRLGEVNVQRQEGAARIAIKTPGMMTATSRGVVPHLSRDHVRLTRAICWVHVPFETFLEHNPPLPITQPGPRPLHQFLGFSPADHVLSVSARDPFDGRDMPANNKDYVATYCIRGVRKLTPEVWAQYDAACNPDIITALSDTPFTSAPHSNKRTHKSLERSTAWLANLLHSVAARRREVGSDGEPLTGSLSNVLVHMAGGAVVQARKAFAEGLMEDLEEFKAVNPSPYRRLDDGVAGYVFDLVPLRAALSARSKAADEDLGDDADTLKPRGAINTLTPTSSADTSAMDPAALSEVLRASLQPLPTHKPRLVNSARSPHEMLRLVRDVGIDLFDAHWAQRAADIGVALDFAFPVALGDTQPVDARVAGSPRTKVRPGEKMDLGHNLYSGDYAHDHSRLAANFLDGRSHAQQTAEGSPDARPVCPCGACSPRSPGTHILHSALDRTSWEGQAGADTLEPPFMRSYVHHLLHTHEMSAHSLLVMHNLSVLDAFFVGIRSVLEHAGTEEFNRQVDLFLETYDEEMVLFDEAKVDWVQVEMARGKGRLAREKIKQAESSLGTSVDV
ncbi:tRNA-guanine(15) transglycosylase-like protein [Rhodofomes roseus]|uniref:tRNA-guanine(15) transglycosylase-like protein n=1 Tax=Rhodofomes roseus TaxID=34475 RepID=A0ABQ8KV29_9APHY|nr:tRNA-guanine(15) transglycosylase-like protein [Rhodofomes roseus]KAH9842883.1 tRNA-guanine(15) transglycosylase-like protein [Rhodofomes roseus]